MGAKLMRSELVMANYIYVNLTGPPGAQTSDSILFLGVFIRVIPEALYLNWWSE